MSTLTSALEPPRARRWRILDRVGTRRTRVRTIAARAWIAVRRMDTGTVMLILGLLFAVVFVYALGVTTLTRRH